ALAQDSNALEELDPDLANKPKKKVVHKEDTEDTANDQVEQPVVKKQPPVVKQQPVVVQPVQPPVVKQQPVVVQPVQPKVEPKVDPKVEQKAPPVVDPKAKVDATAKPVVEPPKEEPKPRDTAKPILTTKVTDETLQATWDKWRKAHAALDVKGAEAAEQELRTEKAEIGASDLESFAMGFSRASEARRNADDPAGAVRLASIGVELAPHLPYTHIELARAYFQADPSEFGRVIAEGKTALMLTFSEPRYLRPAVADLAAAALYALVATAAAVILMLFIRRSRYFFHDFHHLFPKAAATWQSAALALVLLALPIVFRMGAGPVLLALFLAVAMYLSLTERIVAAALIALLAAVPFAGGAIVDHTAFAGTPAEDVYRLEHGGLDATSAATRIRAHFKEGHATFAEIYALGRFELRRGNAAEAIDLFKQAAALKPGDARTLTNLGNAMMAKGDEEGALGQYTAAVQADGSLAAASYNLSRIYYRRAKQLPDADVGAMLDQAQTALTESQRLDPNLLTHQDPPDDNLQANLLLLSPELPLSEISDLADLNPTGDTVARQLSSQLFSATQPENALMFGAGAALLIIGFGYARRGANASMACDKCGRPVCKRCDPELVQGGTLCNQCVHVFARKGAVPPPVKVRKQHEVALYQTRLDRLSYLFGSLCSGAGHIFVGTPIRGAIYAFLFLFVLMNFVFRSGVLRAPFGATPELLRIVPLAIAFLLVYGLTLRGLYKRQTE
ncbi:MAG: tetratricopeptide repeat protein, partial [Myxococcaceae bacterium]